MNALLKDHNRRHREEHAVDDIVNRIRRGLEDRVNQGLSVVELGEPDQLASVFLHGISEPSPWPDIVGPVFTSGRLQQEVGLGRGAISKAARELRLLRLDTPDGVSLYPRFQVRNGHIIPGLGKVLRALNEGFHGPLMWAQWLNSPVPRPDGATRRRIDELVEGHVDELVEEARQTAAAWAA